MKRSPFWTGLFAGVALTVLAVNWLPRATVVADEKSATDKEDAESKDEAPMLYELRTYYTPEGKLDALNSRFRDHTLRIFEKHGMKNVIYLTPTDKDNMLVYLIAHKSEDAAAASWKAFGADPEWKKVAEETQRDGRLVEKVERMYLTPTDYSPMK